MFTYREFYQAYQHCRKGKRHTKEVVAFEYDLSQRLLSLLNAVNNGTYQHNPYNQFLVTDSKRRVISAATFEDRIINHALCQKYLIPLIDSQLLANVCACRTKKGTSYARNKLRNYINLLLRQSKSSNIYVLRLDIQQFYASISHAEILKSIESYALSNEVKLLCRIILTSYEESEGTGLPLGNQTSQWWANDYLSTLDELIVQQLKHSYYLRYMDDLIILHESKKILNETLEAIQFSLRDKCLTLHPKKTQLFPLKNGSEWLGWRYRINEESSSYKVLPQRVKRRLLKKWSKKFIYLKSKQTLLHYLKQGKTYYVRKRLLTNIN